MLDIEIPKNSKIYSCVDNKYLLKKSDPNNPTFDIFSIARRNIEEVIIPSYIKVIDASAFDGCMKLKTVTFEPNSTV